MMKKILKYRMLINESESDDSVNDESNKIITRNNNIIFTNKDLITLKSNNPISDDSENDDDNPMNDSENDSENDDDVSDDIPKEYIIIINKMCKDYKVKHPQINWVSSYKKLIKMKLLTDKFPLTSKRTEYQACYNLRKNYHNNNLPEWKNKLLILLYGKNWYDEMEKFYSSKKITNKKRFSKNSYKPKKIINKKIVYNTRNRNSVNNSTRNKNSINNKNSKILLRENKYENIIKLLKEYYNKNNKFPNLKETYKDIDLGKYYFEMVNGYWNFDKCISNIIIEKMNDITPNWTIKYTDSLNIWMRNYNYLIKFINKNKRIPKFRDKYESEFGQFSLGQWVECQRRKIKYKKLNKEQISLLQDAGIL